ncbi:zealexin A1 synthase-like [Panicum virgatum]|uniref:Uncharacterized protein n=1 Tax=Panicum virgatum TaxID=38727 RepID=A0A8T0R849_PANVG|nr:zealexin A1 synthase-like [Panicum virgatum]XP_039853042.1 zealexin A1 synthase-like [Panicum virgatum]XP_039853043.1 zealexin A1 synthase-like [Panicum virgatum]KAG2581902.1 hypothetical protein PVAP13_6KG082650 [Panicum virgatum]KAG2581911.1 hypothetical protein PVAP13_6KG077870 [Panicum virgatum]KAG2581912.1 hypothetical protein PVAP13_6KG078505 [Panicum virgatum]
MEDHQHCLYLVLALVSLLVILLAKRRRSAAAPEHGLRLPPGPWQLPIIGSLHHMIGKLPHHAMRDLARRHGPLMLLQLGEVPTLVVSSREAAREVMRTHDAVFATRPMSPTMRALTDGGRGIIMAPYGAHWRQLRRITITKLLSARRVNSFRAVREEEAAVMLRVCAAAAAESRAVNMRERLSELITDTTMRAAMGDRIKDREVLLRALDEAIVLAAGFNPADLWPSSRIVSWLSSAVRRSEEIRQTSFGILDEIIKDHLERMERGDGGEVEDLLDVLLKVQKDGELPIPLDTDVIKVAITDIFAGSETTAPTLEWAMAELVQNPKVMERATAEVRRAFAAHGSVREEKLVEAGLQYLPLVIRETLRLHTPLPFLIPQACQEPCRVLGYDVPQGITVMVNAWALGRDERYWPGDPDAFRPERFEAGGGSAADFKGTDYELLPFGAGRRMCPGLGFGLANMELALASLLFHFDWEVPGGAKLDMTEAFGITAHRKSRLLLRPILRVPVPGV